MDRRSFMGWVGLGWLASCLPIALVACSSENTTTGGAAGSGGIATPGVPDAEGFQTVGTVADLDKNGQLIVKNFGDGELVVIRNPADSQSLVAVNSQCPHKGCIVEWKADKQEFVCPCHDSDFGADGKVLEGPATESLKVYGAKVDGDSVRVKV